MEEEYKQWLTILFYIGVAVLGLLFLYKMIEAIIELLGALAKVVFFGLLIYIIFRYLTRE